MANFVIIHRCNWSQNIISNSGIGSVGESMECIASLQELLEGYKDIVR